MADALPILHHHDPSPFAEKIRLVFGIKQLAWASVRIPMMVPKPDLMALTGGYRGTPVLQIGGDVYCDTRLIVAEIERRHPVPPLLGSGELVNFGLQHWSDDAVFPLGSALAMHYGAAQMPDGLLAERAAYFTNLDFDRFGDDAPYFSAQIMAHLSLIERQLSDGRRFLLGEAVEWADVNAYFPVWMLGGHVPGSDAMLSGKPNLIAWRDRVAAFGTGDRSEIDAEQAIAIASATALSPEDAGRSVRVWPISHPDTAVSGRLVAWTDDRITIRRNDPRAGDVNVHFPAIGYRVEDAD